MIYLNKPITGFSINNQATFFRTGHKCIAGKRGLTEEASAASGSAFVRGHRTTPGRVNNFSTPYHYQTPKPTHHSSEPTPSISLTGTSNISISKTIE